MVMEEREKSDQESEGTSLRLGEEEEEEGIRLEKSNILILGPTGSGTCVRQLQLDT